MQVRELLTVIGKDVPPPPSAPSPLLRKKRLQNTNRNHRQAASQASCKSLLVLTHRCKVNHAIASQSVILCLLLRTSDKPVRNGLRKRDL